MSRALFSQYHKDDPGVLAVRLQKDYYNLIGYLCDCVEKLSDELASQDQTLLYFSLSKHLVSEIREELNYRQTSLIPYITELRQKQQTGHNCRTCSGNCQVNHLGHLQQIKAAHQHIKEILYRIHQTTGSIQEDNKYVHPISRTLVNEIALLDTTLTELFYLEEAILIPKIMELQSQINIPTGPSI